MAAYRRILRHLRSLRDEGGSAAGSLADVLAALAAAGWPSGPCTNRILRAAYVGGITVATAAAGAAGVLVWMSAGARAGATG